MAEKLTDLVKRIQPLVVRKATAVARETIVQGGYTDHGNLTGREDDDHSLYLNIARHDSLLRHPLGTVVPHDTLDALGNPLDSKAFAQGNKSIVFSFTNPSNAPAYNGAFEIEATGAFSGDLLHIHQHTGNPGAVDLLHLEAEDGDVLPLRVVGEGTNLTEWWHGAAQVAVVTNAGQFETGHLMPRLTDTYDLGSSTKLWRKGWLSELDTILFAENTITLLGGWFMIPKAQGSFPGDVAPAHDLIDFGQALPGVTTNPSTYQPFVLVRTSLQMEYMKVLYKWVADAGDYRYYVSRNVDGSGANTWPAGVPWVMLGNTGDGRIELNAYDTPRISLFEQGAVYNSGVERLRIGDLNLNWGYAASTYGVAIGEYAADKPNITIDPVNGMRFRTYTNTVIQFDVAGNADIIGTLRLPGASSALAIGATPPTAANAGTGLWLDRTGLYSLKANVYQIKIDAETGALVAGGGNVTLDANGINIYSGAFTQSRSIAWTNGFRLWELRDTMPGGNNAGNVEAPQKLITRAWTSHGEAKITLEADYWLSDGDHVTRMNFQAQDINLQANYINVTGMLTACPVNVTPSLNASISQMGGNTLQILAPGSGGTSGSAAIALHRPNNFACYFGLDTDNQLKIGGWSMGQNAYKIWHDGNREYVETRRNGAMTVTPNQWVTIPWEQETINKGFTGSGNGYLAPVSGMYTVTLSIAWSDMADGDGCSIYWQVAGSNMACNYHSLRGAFALVTDTAVIYAAAGQKIEPVLYQATNGNRTISANYAYSPYLRICHIG